IVARQDNFHKTSLMGRLLFRELCRVLVVPLQTLHIVLYTGLYNDI
ncbi:DNA-packaging protein FI, partial [Shigella dysenteriae]